MLALRCWENVMTLHFLIQLRSSWLFIKCILNCTISIIANMSQAYFVTMLQRMCSVCAVYMTAYVQRMCRVCAAYVQCMCCVFAAYVTYRHVLYHLFELLVTMWHKGWDECTWLFHHTAVYCAYDVTTAPRAEGQKLHPLLVISYKALFLASPKSPLIPSTIVHYQTWGHKTAGKKTEGNIIVQVSNCENCWGHKAYFRGVWNRAGPLQPTKLELNINPEARFQLLLYLDYQL